MIEPNGVNSLEMQKHSHYKKDVQHLAVVDVYRVLEMFNVTDPALQHAVKKLLVAGGRGAGKDIGQDVQEAIDSLLRFQTMRAEDAARGQCIVYPHHLRQTDLEVAHADGYLEAQRKFEKRDEEASRTRQGKAAAIRKRKSKSR